MINLTEEEFYRVHQFSIYHEIEIIGKLLNERDNTKFEKVISNSKIERLEEQVFFAQELVESIKEFSKTLPKSKRSILSAILENSSFET